MSDIVAALAADLDREPACRCVQTDRGTDTLGCDRHEPGVLLDRALALRALSALRATLTTAGHLAQRVTHERLGYCSHRTESERCATQRALIAALSAALEEDS